MALLNTGEVVAKFEENNIRVNPQEIRDLADDGTLSHHRIHRRYYFAQSVVDSHLKVRVIETSTVAENTQSKRGRIREFFRGIRLKRLKWYRKTGVGKITPVAILGLILLGVGIVLWICSELFPRIDIEPVRYSAFLVIAMGVTMAMVVLIEEFKESKLKAYFISVEGVAVVFFGTFLVLGAAHVYWDPRDRIQEAKADAEKTWKAQIESQKLLISDHQQFSKNLPQLFSDENILVPMKLNVAISCYEKGAEINFGYLQNSENLTETSVSKGIGINSLNERIIELPLSNGEFLLYKDKMPWSDLIAGVKFDNTSLLEPKLTVHVTGRSLCPTPVDTSIVAADVRANIITLSQNNDFLDRNRLAYNLVQRINATADPVQLASVGDTLVSLVDDENEIVSKLALNTLASIDRWTSSRITENLDYLSKKLVKVNPGEDNQLAEFHNYAVNRAIDGLRPAIAACRPLTLTDVDTWVEYSECLDLLNGAQVTEGVLVEREFVKLKLALFKSFDDRKVELGAIGKNLLLLANGMSQPEQSSTLDKNVVLPVSYRSDALILSSLSGFLGGETQLALDVLPNPEEMQDTVIDRRLIEGIVGNISSEVNVQLLSSLLRVIYDIDFESKVDANNLTPFVAEFGGMFEKLRSTNYQVMIEARLSSENDAEDLVRFVRETLESDLNTLVLKYPDLLSSDSIKLSAIPASSGGGYNVVVAPGKSTKIFTIASACEVKVALRPFFKQNVEVFGGDATCSI